MAGIVSEIDEAGLITNTIKKGVGMSFRSIIFEKLDNSIDANANNINIIIDKIDCEVSMRGRTEKINSYVLIVSDDGDGMKEEDNSLQGLLSLFKTNENSNNNGIYGIGSIASDLALGKSDTNKITIYFTRAKGIKQDFEIVIPWESIFNDKSKMVWSNKVSINNISSINKKLLKRYRLNKSHGTTVINFFDEDYLTNINIEELYYYIQRNYYSYLQDGVNINIKKNLTEEDSESEYSNDEESSDDEKSVKEKVKEYIEYNCNSENSIDVLSVKEISDDSSLGCTVNSKINTFYNSEKKLFGFQFIIENYQLGKTILDKKISKYLFPITQSQNPKTLSTKFNLKDWENIGHFNYNISLITADIIKKDQLLMNKYFTTSSSTKYTGLFLERNKRILCDPSPLEGIRNSQNGNNWRSKLIWNNNKKLDDLIRPQLNKSQLNMEDFNKTLYRAISLFTKEFYWDFYNKVICPKDKIFVPCNEWDFKMWKLNDQKEEKEYSFLKTKIKPKSLVEEIKDDKILEDNSKVKQKTYPIKSKIINSRKGFNSSQEKDIILNQKSKCNILDITLNKKYMPYDKDHIDSNSSNNNTNNLQLISLIAHRHKTNSEQHGSSEYNEMLEDKGIFIAEMINCLSSSKYFKKLMSSDKISIRSGPVSDNGILIINKDSKKNIEV